MPEANVYGLRSPLEHTCLDAAVAGAWGTSLKLGEYRNAVISIKTTGFSGTLKLAGSCLQTEPTWSAIDAVRLFDYKTMVDMQDRTNRVDGDTGITYTIDSDYQEYEVDSNFINWLNVVVTRTAGSITVKIRYSMDDPS